MFLLQHILVIRCQLSRHEWSDMLLVLRNGLLIHALILGSRHGDLVVVDLRLVLQSDVGLVLGKIVVIWMHLQLQ